MPVELLRVGTAAEAGSAAARIRALVPGGGHVAEGVAALIDDVRTRGDAALAEHATRFDRADGVPFGPLVVPDGELDAAVAGLDAELRAALELAIDNVAAVSRATVHEDRDVELPQGQRVRVREVPVRRAAVYVPGGRAPYPSTAIMGVVAARAAGVDEVVVATPSDDPVLRAACRLAGVDRVYRMGGAHGVAALALGTETVDRVDVVVGPGNLWVQEAKRQLAGVVGIDGFAGPSDLLVLADGAADPQLAALDLGAQAEHGEGSLVVLVTDDEALQAAVLAQLEAGVGGGAPLAGTGAAYASVVVPDPEVGLAVAEAFAAEHLELVGPTIEPLAPRVRSAGCVFVGGAAATAFGDYVAGSNHTLPTDGAARFASTLSARTFRRTMNEVHLGDAAGALAGPGGRIADAEGFVVHAASMRARQNGQGR
ncbi:histidinol dehydrogenase [Patulibacter americanus]|uniref:histidinol dehydrogenase n=1 Tax=Patulibacter americanus TaxID=588672 RepID=UPI0003B67EE2|nr:histidinol dehydrogenase [Patulibacter americanus]